MRLYVAVRSKSSDEQGFTIVELMIATMVFSVILTILTAGVVSFTTRYYRGINASTTQTTARTIMDTIGQAIQFGTAQVETGGSGHFCAGGYRFTFDTTGTKYDPASTATGLQMAKMGATCDASPASDSKQLLGKNMRLTTLSVTKVGSTDLYRVELGLAYGDDDLLCDGTTCDSSSNPSTYWRASLGANDLRCRSSAGSQFCATSKLTTTVAKRIGT